jgi:hypothetical protein
LTAEEVDTGMDKNKIVIQIDKTGIEEQINDLAFKYNLEVKEISGFTGLEAVVSIGGNIASIISCLLALYEAVGEKRRGTYKHLNKEIRNISIMQMVEEAKKDVKDVLDK